MKIKRFLAQLLSAVLCMTLAGCYGNESDAKKNIAVIVKAVDSDFWHSVKNGVNSAAIEYNVSVSFEGPENEEDYKAQNDMIKKAVSDGADVIILSAIDYVKSNDAVEYAVKNGVKVITIDSSIESENVSLFIGTDNVGAGRAAGEAAVSGFSSDEKIYIGLVNYNADTDNGRQRETGFREYIKNVENAQIITMVTADSNAESATAAAASLIKGYPEINVLVGFNEWMTLGVGNAIKQLGVKDTVRGIGFDSNVISVGMIETGEMDTLIVQNPFAIGYLGVKNAAVLASGGSISEKTIYTAVTPVNKENLFDEDVQKIIFRFS